MGNLTEYNRKRSFKKTPEPRGTVMKSGKKLRYVVQKHAAKRLHYDFRLELDGVLKSWAVPKGPSMTVGEKRLAMMTEDHPLSYRTFEGKIPEGEYGAGAVEIWDEGLYMSSETADPEESRKKIKSGLYRGEIKMLLYGKKLRGAFVLIKMKRGREENAWLLIKERGEYGQKGEGKKKEDPMPRDVKPMLARLVDEPFDRKRWLFEVKWDGYRAIAEIKGGEVRLYSRNGISFAEKYHPVAEALKKIRHDCVLDGEIVALKNGKPDFHTLQQYAEIRAPLQYALFDLLYLDGENIEKKPLRERKELLKDILPRSELLLYSEHVETEGMRFFETMRKEKIEGMIAKDALSPYLRGTRSDSWLKVKTFELQEALIVGFTKPRGSRTHFGALVLAAHKNGRLSYIGHSGGGFSAKELKDLHERLKKIEIRTSPISEKVPINSPITWVKPKYVCQMRFTEWTRDGRMRHPIYAGLRIDKKPEEVVQEIPRSFPKKEKTRAKRPETEVGLTNTDKIFWPKEKYRKGDVIEYYEKMADLVLPYLIDRPENLHRHPNGIEGKSFYQKNITGNVPSFAETKAIWSESNKENIRYLLCQNKETLLYMANLGCIELNPWNSRIGALDKPDYMIFDLDPGENTFDELIEVAKEVGKVLNLACEEFYAKTSGKTGIHIVVPLGARYSYDDIRTFAELVANIVHRRLPSLTSVERSPAKRKKKIYLDYLQNSRGQTLSAPYSLRPYPGATVSTPLEWKEVKKGLDPRAFNIKSIWKRLDKKGDLWKPVLEKGIDLADSIRCLQEHTDEWSSSRIRNPLTKFK